MTIAASSARLVLRVLVVRIRMPEEGSLRGI